MLHHLPLLLALAAPPRLAFVDVNVVPMDGREIVLPHHTVLVAGDRVERVGPTADVRVPPDARRIEGAGRYLVPGLADLHVHLADEGDLVPYVANGVTTVRNLAGYSAHLAWRERVASGELFGPTIFTAGGPISGLHDPAAAEAIVAEQADAGYDGIKLYDDLTKEAYGALVAAARKHGISPSGHVPRNLRLEDALAFKPDSIDHLEEFIYSRFAPDLDPGAIERTARETRDAGTSVCTTLVTYDLIGRQVADPTPLLDRFQNRYVGPVFRRLWGPAENSYRKSIAIDRVPELRRRLAFQKKLLAGLRDAGVRILLGTDAGGPPFVLHGFSAHEELRHLGDALTPYEALRAATSDAAAFLGGADEFGSIVEGRRADLVLVHGNPLEDVTNASLIAGVVLRGTWLPAEDLRARLDALAALRAGDERLLATFLASGADAAAAEIAAGRGPKSFVTLNELGFQRLRIERRGDDALAAFELNTRAFPDSADAWSSYAETLEELSKLPDALRAWRRVRDLVPSRKDATRAIMRLAR